MGNKEEYNGWYEVTTKPFTYTMITRRQQCTFKNLVNSQSYKFRVYAVNIIGKSNRLETDSIKRKQNVKEKLYNTLKSKTAQNINELRQSYYQQIEQKDKKTKKEMAKNKKGKIINKANYFEEKKDAKNIKQKKKKKDRKKKKKKKNKNQICFKQNKHYFRGNDMRRSWMLTAWIN